MCRPGTCVSVTLAALLLASTPSGTMAGKPRVRKPPAQERFLCVQEQCKILADSPCMSSDNSKPYPWTQALNNKTIALLRSSNHKPTASVPKFTNPAYRGERLKIINPVYNGKPVHFILANDDAVESQSRASNRVMSKVIGVVHPDPPSKQSGGVNNGAHQKQP